jgi:hypothetical protein
MLPFNRFGFELSTLSKLIYFNIFLVILVIASKFVRQGYSNYYIPLKIRKQNP